MNQTAVALIVLVPVVVGLAVGLVIVYFTRFRRPFRGPGVTAPAVITGIRQATFFWAGRHPPYFARVDVTPPAGPPFTTEIRLTPAALGPLIEPFGAYARVGMRIAVNFDPANPLRAEINAEASRPPGGTPNRTRRNVAYVVIGVLVLIYVVGGAVLFVVSLS